MRNRKCNRIIRVLATLPILAVGFVTAMKPAASVEVPMSASYNSSITGVVVDSSLTGSIAVHGPLATTPGAPRGSCNSAIAPLCPRYGGSFYVPTGALAPGQYEVTITGSIHFARTTLTVTNTTSTTTRPTTTTTPRPSTTTTTRAPRECYETLANFSIAFQLGSAQLGTFKAGGKLTNMGLGMAPGTSPAITTLTGGGTQIAFQANTGMLWTAGAAGTRSLGIAMAPGTSPSITALAKNGYAIAVQGSDSVLRTTGTMGNTAWGLGMRAGTSPSITKLTGGGIQIGFVANTGEVWTAGTVGIKPLGVLALSGTSPSIAPLAKNGYSIAAQGTDSVLRTTGSAGTQSFGLGMRAGSSPSITTLTGGGQQIAFVANTGELWTAGKQGTRALGLGVRAGTSPSITAMGSNGYVIATQSDGRIQTFRSGDGTCAFPVNATESSITSPSVTRL